MLFQLQVRALACLLLLAGCGDIPKARTEEEIRQIAADEASASFAKLNDRIAALEDKLQEKDAEIAAVRGLAIANVNDHESLRKTFNNNVKIENEAAVRAMTARGACGTEVINYPNGGVVYRNKECTLKDLR